MRIPDAISYIYHGQPRVWKGKVVSTNTRLALAAATGLLAALLSGFCAGLVLYEGRTAPGIALLAATLLFIALGAKRIRQILEER